MCNAEVNYLKSILNSLIKHTGSVPISGNDIEGEQLKGEKRIEGEQLDGEKQQCTGEQCASEEQINFYRLQGNLYLTTICHLFFMCRLETQCKVLSGSDVF